MPTMDLDKTLEMLRQASIFPDLSVRHSFVEVRLYMPQATRQGGVKIKDSGPLKSLSEANEWLLGHLPPSLPTDTGA